jgi:hypothetical protein
VDYLRIYKEFIADRRNKEAKLTASNEYCEKHHIVPRSLGGSNCKSNLISLNPADHLFAHLLLAKSFGGKQWGGLWAVAGMNKGTVRGRQRNFRNAIKCRKWVNVARKNYAASQEKAGNHNADLTVYKFCNVNTGETYTGNIYEAPFDHKAFQGYKKPETKFFAGGWFLLSDYNLEQALLIKAQQSQNRAKSKKGKDCRKFMKIHTVTNIKTGAVLVGTALDFPFSKENLSGHITTFKNYGQKYLIKGEWFSNEVFDSIEEAKIWAEKVNTQRKNQLPKAKSGAESLTAKKVINLDTGVLFLTISAAAKNAGLKGPGPISNHLAGKSKTAGGYRWALA